MKKLKAKYPNSDVFIISAVFLLVFWLFCTKLIIKMDDGHFLGILANDDFSLAQWLRHRYDTVSGRTVAEGMMMTFLSTNPVLWKIFGFALCEYIIYFIYKIASGFNVNTDKRKISVISCCSIFLIFAGILNAGAFWFAGSFTFLVPCTFMLIAITPAVFDFLEIKYHFIHKIIAVFCAIVASSQEQASVSTCAFLVCLFALCIIRKRLKISSFIPLIPAVAGTVYLLTSPGVTNRGIQQAADSFEVYSQFGILKKLLLGFSNYCSYTFFFSVFITLLFTVLLSALLRSLYNDSKKMRLLSVAAPVATVSVSLIYNLIHQIIAKKSIDNEFKDAFTDNSMNIWVYLTAALCGAVIIIWAVMLFFIIKKNFTLGITLALLCCAAAGCGLMMGFSSSIYASGKRVFFYSELMMIISCVILFASLKDSKFSNITYRIAVIASGVFYAFDTVNLLFLEIPIMN